jgi:hypothetical protein
VKWVSLVLAKLSIDKPSLVDLLAILVPYVSWKSTLSVGSRSPAAKSLLKPGLNPGQITL